MRRLRDSLWEPMVLFAIGLCALAAIVAALVVAGQSVALLPLPVVAFVQYRLTVIALGTRPRP